MASSGRGRRSRPRSASQAPPIDMDELTAHRVVSDCDLRWVIIPDTILELYKVAYACE